MLPPTISFPRYFIRHLPRSKTRGSVIWDDSRDTHGHSVAQISSQILHIEWTNWIGLIVGLLVIVMEDF